ncbi:MAG: hypothetical protein R3D43_04395 [Tepidamorphaceae bacterium]
MCCRAVGTVLSLKSKPETAAVTPANTQTSVKWKPEETGGSNGDSQPTQPERNVQVAGLRLRIDETLMSDSVSQGVNDADARLHSLIIRHDRLAEMVEDLQDSGINVTLKVEDLIPTTLPARAVGKPRVLDTQNANARHPLFAFVHDIREELSNALREPEDSASPASRLLTPASTRWLSASSAFSTGSRRKSKDGMRNSRPFPARLALKFPDAAKATPWVDRLSR